MVDIHREYLPKQLEGVVNEIVKYKGGGYDLIIDNSGEMESIAVSKSVGAQTNLGDYFVKIKNSNKCQLKRKDSILCLDCLNLTKEDKDSVGKISEWKMFEKNKWMAKRDEKASQ